MKGAWSICKREMLSYFVSPVAYFVLTGFILLSGYFFINLLVMFNDYIAQALSPYGQMMGARLPSVNQVVIEGFYQTLLVILVLFIPLLTMRLVAEEKRKGTFELLVTSPLTVTDIIIGKFLGVSIIITLMAVTAWFFPAILIAYSEPEVLPIFSGLLGLLLYALAFASIGLAASAFTENQIIAAVIGFVALLLLYMCHVPADSIGGVIGEVLRFMSPVLQVQDLMRGVISLKSISYFVSVILVGLFLSQRALEAQRWR